MSDFKKDHPYYSQQVLDLYDAGFENFDKVRDVIIANFLMSPDFSEKEKVTFETLDRTSPNIAWSYLWTLFDLKDSKQAKSRQQSFREQARKAHRFIPRRFFLV